MATSPMTARAQPSPTHSVRRRRHVEPGSWATLEQFWNARGTAFFRNPADARIRVRYGVGWFGNSRQGQTLDGREYERLIVGKAGVTRARMQVKVTKPSDITYEVRGGGVAVDFPKRRF